MCLSRCSPTWQSVRTYVQGNKATQTYKCNWKSCDTCGLVYVMQEICIDIRQIVERSVKIYPLIARSNFPLNVVHFHGNMRRKKTAFLQSLRQIRNRRACDVIFESLLQKKKNKSFRQSARNDFSTSSCYYISQLIVIYVLASAVKLITARQNLVSLLAENDVSLGARKKKCWKIAT